MRLILGVVVAAMVPASATASNWIDIGTDQGGDKYAVDAASMVHTGTSWTIWEKAYYLKTHANTATTLTSRIVIDCAQRTYKILQTVEHNAAGSQVYMWDAPTYTSPEGIVPDTVIDQTSQIVCAIKG